MHLIVFRYRLYNLLILLNELERGHDIGKVDGKILVNRCIVKASLGQVLVVNFGKLLAQLHQRMLVQSVFKYSSGNNVIQQQKCT